MIHRIDIPEASPSLNQYAYRHWRVRQKDKRRWEGMIGVALLVSPVPRAKGPRRLIIERHGKRRLDPDNLIGGAKGIIDCLRAEGLLLDDHDDAVQLVAKNVPLAKGEKPYTILVLEDL